MSNWSEVGIQCGKKVYEKLEEVFLEFPQEKPNLEKELSDGSRLLYWDAIKWYARTPFVEKINQVFRSFDENIPEDDVSCNYRMVVRSDAGEEQDVWNGDETPFTDLYIKGICLPETEKEWVLLSANSVNTEIGMSTFVLREAAEKQMYEEIKKCTGGEVPIGTTCGKISFPEGNISFCISLANGDQYYWQIKKIRS